MIRMIFLAIRTVAIAIAAYALGSGKPETATPMLLIAILATMDLEDEKRK